MRFLLAFLLSVPAATWACDRSCTASAARDSNGCCVSTKQLRKRQQAIRQNGGCLDNTTCPDQMACVDSHCARAIRVDVHLKNARILQTRGGKNARTNALRELKLATLAYQRDSQDQKVNNQMRRDAAESAFLQAEYLRADYVAVKLGLPIRDLHQNLMKKAKLLQQVEKLYLGVLKYQVPDVSAGALFRIGQNYQAFGQSLLDMPTPAGLTKDQQAIYRVELNNRAAPLSEKAIKSMRRAVALNRKHQVENDWAQRAIAFVAQFEPKTHKSTGQGPNTPKALETIAD